MKRLLPPLLALASVTAAPAAAGEVPFVGCASDGQVGPIAPPERSEIDHVPAEAEAGLAYYATHATGTLAPAGWNCFAAHGSNGERLVVAPLELDFEAIVADAGLRGPAVEIDHEYGFTSGRYAVAAMILRHFPAHIDHARAVEEMEIPLDPPESFGTRDRILPMGDDALAFVTPAGAEGIGTRNALAADGEPIAGLVLLLPEADMSMQTLGVRGLGDPALTRAILAAAAADRRLALPAGFPVTPVE
jgi:hypothetical protein